MPARTRSWSWPADDPLLEEEEEIMTMSAISSMARAGGRRTLRFGLRKHGGRSGCVRPRSLSAVRGRQRRLLCDCFGTICRPAGRTDALAADNCSKKIRPRGYTGGYSNLERLLTNGDVRNARPSFMSTNCEADLTGVWEPRRNKRHGRRLCGGD